MNKRLLIASSCLTIIIGCVPSVTQQEAAKAVEGYIQDVNKLAVVDCLLPGQMRKLGTSMTYLSARRPIRTTEADCEVRGGEYVAYDRANYASALNVWQEKANEGDATAQFYVGQIYEKGLGRAADYRSAALWYRKAADQGFSQAQINLGHLYEKGLGVPKEQRTALDWYGRAAGLSNAGLMYAAASNISRSPIRTQSQPVNTPFTQSPTPTKSNSNASLLLAKELAESRKLREQLDLARQNMINQQAMLRHSQEELAALKRSSRGPESVSQQARQDDHATRLREAELAKKESIIREQESELARMGASLQAERAKMESEKPERKPANALTSVDPRLRKLEEELAKKESQLQAKQAEITQMNRAVDTERAKMQREMASAIQQSKSTTFNEPNLNDAKISELEASLREKESQLNAQQAKVKSLTKSTQIEREKMQEELNAKRNEIVKLNQSLDAERAKAQNEVASTMRQAAASPLSPNNDARIRELEADLKQKENLLKEQQAKVSSINKSVKAERAKMQKELKVALSKSSDIQAQAANSRGEPAGLEQTRQELNRIETDLEAKTALYNQNSAELTSWLTSPNTPTDDATHREQINRRKQDLQKQAQEIAGLRDQLTQATKKLEEAEQGPLQTAQAGPNIEIIQPEILMTRGIPTMQVSPDLRELLGRVVSTHGLGSLSANGTPLSADGSGMFKIPFASSPPDKLQITAIDKKNQRTDFNLNLVISGNIPVSESIETSSRGSKGLSYKDVDMGKFYALIIANSDYTAYPDLKTPLNDAKSIDVLLRERYGFSTKVVMNGSRHDIMTAFNDMQRRLTEKDNLLIYYAGHGEIDGKTQEAYWLPVDADVGNTANWIASKAITDLLSIMPARHILVVSDSCYSGAMTGSAIAKLPDDIDPDKKEKWLKVMATKKARTVLTSGDVSPVLDEGGEGHSVFAEAFLRALRGNKGLLEDYELYREVANKVSTASSKLGFKQNPSYAPLQYAGHEGSPFFFLPNS